MKLEDSSICISPCLKVTFVGCKYNRGVAMSTGKPWTSLTFIFVDEFNKKFEFKQYQPKTFIERITYATYLGGILDGLSGKKLWNGIPRNNSWELFYETYLLLIQEFRNKDCFIKTVPEKSWKDPTASMATLAFKDFISLKPELKYSVIEESMSQELYEAPVEYKERVIFN